MYTSQYLFDTTFLLQHGWTEENINTIIPLLESLDDQSLRELHRLCNIAMFAPDESVDEEQAVWVLINPQDTPKDLLFSALAQLNLISTNE